jgi:hypothetical protein
MKQRRKAIVVLGCHRAGTSALGGALVALGASPPKHLMPPRADNPSGSWESTAVIRFNEGLLQDAGRAWDDPRPLPDGWLSPAGRERDIAGAADLLRKEFPEGSPIALKDPRMSRLLPVWLPALRRAGFAPLLLIACRNPVEVAASLQKRNGIDADKAQQLWLAHSLEALRDSAAETRAVVCYDELIADWRGTLDKALRATGTTLAEDFPAADGPTGEAAARFLDAASRHHVVSTDALLADPAYSGLVKECYASLRAAAAGSSVDQAAVNRYSFRLGDAWHILAPSAMTTRKTKSAVAVSPTQKSAPAARRKVILHYHLFKNAGTSVDQMLKAQFGAAWQEAEAPQKTWGPTEIAAWLQAHPDVVVLSSHTAVLPAPRIDGVEIFPIIFLRHPLDRVRSVYDFEHKQVANTDGARAAKEASIADYIRWRLSRRGDRTIRNFQTHRLAMAVPQGSGGIGSEVGRALHVLERLPFVGIVEYFDMSVLRLQEWLRSAFPDITLKAAKANVTQKAAISLDERLAALKKEVGTALYEEIVAANESDMRVYEQCVTRLQPGV